ncbi:acylphosphatase [Salipaludibacillus sp. LMS25]|uniref:acylphosphatase n=1 Tax=Salipaludibacillus sp. LMS25 TaxID=2924031 RepID=UPI0020D0CE44|nr:acylphosphatase [Salipaludibacillus sp. LMS25]UTR13955.1 acylphosphatase [Salipaludibacillus sp. LMS25]
MQRYHVSVDGNVQGVGFRFNTQMKASEYDVSGWVKNKMDGSVELEVQGEPETVEAFLSALKNVKFPAKVTSLYKKEIDVVEGEQAFSIR